MNIGIVGLGLIGGSLGLDLRSRGHQVFGISRRKSTCEKAIARGAVDDASVDYSVLATSEVVFVCTPLGAILPTVEQLIPHLSPSTVLTDVGSVKVPVVEAVTPLWANFVGGHPMAGTADSGIEAAMPNLFALKPYVLTPVAMTPPQAVETVAQIARSLQATVYYCQPDEHDQAVSWISHLPAMISSTLISTCMSEPDPVVLALAQKLASSGFRDTSRVGGGNPELKVMMARYNRQELLRTLQHYRHNLEALINLIEQEDWIALEQQLTLTQLARLQFVTDSEGS